MNRVLILISCFLLIQACEEESGSLFRSVPEEDSNLQFSNDIEESNDLNILDYLYFYNGGGVAVGDINNDGLPDIYITANQKKNKLYLNKGALKFEDISKKAGVEGNSSWNTGTSMIDINNDGYLDIYVNAVVGINGFRGHNELFINNGDNTFSEQSAKYGLDLDTYSSSTAFLDYDLDGDLDVYVLNHAVHTEESFGKASLRNERSYETGDRLLRNDGTIFTDVSEEAGIYGGINAYGLGISISDFNKDGYPDIFVGNDFHEDDYYYLNQGDGTFKESLREYFGHTSRFSMGNDVADINHDGWPDLMSLDMLPEDEKVLKSSEGDDNIQTLKMRTELYGYHYQFTRNMLFINQHNNEFLETALLSGVAATDWSWSTLIEDFNQDGEQDIYISSGIPKRPNDLDFIRFVSSDKIQDKINDTKLVDQEAFKKMPSGKVSNTIYEGTAGFRFNNRTGDWILKDSLVSGATAYGDFDNDGDLDIVINNLNSSMSLLENKTNNTANYLKIKFNYLEKNPFGIGTKVYSYNKGMLQFKELYTVRGFQASSEPIVHFGYKDATMVDSLKIVWPNKTYQIITGVKTNQTLTISPENTRPYNFKSDRTNSDSLFSKVIDNFGLDFIHKEDRYLDFNRQKLIPYQYSTRGPAVAVGDINNDGTEDLFFGGSKFIPSTVYLQKSEGFEQAIFNTIKADSINEETSAILSDFNQDGKTDLFVGTGGADFFGNAKPLLNKIYLQGENDFNGSELEELYGNASVTLPLDFDDDGDLDIFVGNNIVTGDFGNIPESYILENNNGNFSKFYSFKKDDLGMISDAIWSDFDGDGSKDLIIVGEWMSPKFYKYDGGNAFLEVKPLSEGLNGLWQSVIEFDIDNDGDFDYLLANWGINTKFRASASSPLKMYYNDFDGDGQTETIVANEYKGDYYPIANFDELSSQMVSLKKRYNTYKSFAGSSMEQIFENSILEKAKVFEVQELKSGYLQNNGGTFKFVPFKDELQVSPILSFLKFDFNGDGDEEVLTAGNFFGVTPYHGRFDGFTGALIYDDKNIDLGTSIGLDLTQKSVRHLNIVSVNKEPYLLVTFNNDKPEFYKIKD